MILRMKREEHFKRIDKLERASELIYKQQLNYSLNFCKLISTVSLGGMTSLCSYKLLLAKNILEEQSEAVGKLVADTSDLYGFLIGFYVFNIAILVCINLLPLRIYRLGEEYVAILPGVLPMINLKLSFKKGELIENFYSKIFPNDVSFKLKQRYVLLFLQHFRRPSDLYSMLPKSQSKKYLK